MRSDDELARLVDGAGTFKGARGGELEVVRVADVQAELIRWLWPNRFALGKVSLIAGDPGLAKSILTLTMAAHVSRGRPWPVDCTVCPLGDVLLLSAEDDLADTVRPRLEAAGADLERISIVGLVNNREGRRGFCLEKDVGRLTTLIEGMNGRCRLVVIDPVSAFLGAVDSHNNADVRALLVGLSEMAARMRVAVILVSHMNKGGERSNALYRATGSLAFVAAARAAFAVARDKDDPKRRLFLPMKNNLADDQSGLAYRVSTGLNGAPCLVFEPDPVTISADDALAGAGPRPRPRDEAKEWLRALLEDGPVPAAQVWEEAKASGFAEATVKRAKQQLGVDTYKAKGLGAGWMWRLPGAEEDHDEGDHPAGPKK